MEYEETTTKDYMRWLVIVLCVTIAGLIIANPPAVSTINIVLLSLIVLSIASIVLYQIFTAPSDKRIIRKMNKMGFQCQMDEGRISFKRRELNYNILTWDIKKRYRRITFSLGFTDSNLDKDHVLTNKIFCIIASRNRHVTLTWNGTDAYACEFHTVFTSTCDIEREFKTAMRVIDDTMNELYTLFQRAFAQQPTETEHKIGFHVGEDNSATEENTSQIRAQKETETTK